MCLNPTKRACAQDGRERIVTVASGGCAREVVAFTRSLCSDPRFAPQPGTALKGAGARAAGEMGGGIAAKLKEFGANLDGAASNTFAPPGGYVMESDGDDDDDLLDGKALQPRVL